MLKRRRRTVGELVACKGGRAADIRVLREMTIYKISMKKGREIGPER